MADQETPYELYLAACDRVNGLDDLGAQSSVKIDRKLFIDASQLTIGGRISEGHSSIVYEGLYRSTPVAVKVIQPVMSASGSLELKEEFNREVFFLSKLKNENIIQFIGVVLEPKKMIITELMRGGTLQKFLWSIHPDCLDLKVSLGFALCISETMEYLHRNRIIHRDLKPSNLLLSADKMEIKLADFGSARVVADSEMTLEVGTYRWMAPELFSTKALSSAAKKQQYNHKVDVYSFAMVLWELLTNCTPFKGRNNVLVAYAAAMNWRPSTDNIPAEIVPLLESCWAQDPNNRPEFHQVTKYLEDILYGTPRTSLTMHPRSLIAAHSGSNEQTGEGSHSSDRFPKETVKIRRGLSKRLLHHLRRCYRSKP